jgi:metalloendopeptidase OMA1, mitochondrial
MTLKMRIRPGLGFRCRSVCIAVLALVLGLGGCMPPSGEGGSRGGGEGPGHRTQNLILTPEQEYSLGEQAYQKILAKSRVVRSGPEHDRVVRVGNRIVNAAKIEPLQREVNYKLQGYKWEWEFNVLEDRQVNAFCLPGGKVAVFSGLLPVAEDDDQLAVVLGHEISHALAHHANERIAREQYQERALQAAGGLLGRMDPNHADTLIKLLGGVNQVRGLAYDRKQESEADHIGVFLMAFANYNPDEAVRFWERMQQAASSRGGHPPEILSDHPSDARRITDLRKWIPNAKAAKAAFDQHRVVRP